MKTKPSQVEPFDMICNLARRGGISGKIGDFVAQKTIPAAANCASPGNPRQQVRRWIRTPHPNSIRQQFIRQALINAWFVSRLPPQRIRPQAERLWRDVGFIFDTIRPRPDGSERSHIYRAGIRGSIVRSFIREMTRDVSNYGALPLNVDVPSIPTIQDEDDIEFYRQLIPTYNFGLN